MQPKGRHPPIASIASTFVFYVAVNVASNLIDGIPFRQVLTDFFPNLWFFFIRPTVPGFVLLIALGLAFHWAFMLRRLPPDPPRHPLSR